MHLLVKVVHCHHKICIIRGGSFEKLSAYSRRPSSFRAKVSLRLSFYFILIFPGCLWTFAMPKWPIPGFDTKGRLFLFVLFCVARRRFEISITFLSGRNQKIPFSLHSRENSSVYFSLIKGNKSFARTQEIRKEGSPSLLDGAMSCIQTAFSVIIAQATD